MTETKLAIMELFSKYLLCLDERRFDVNSFSEIFTENAEVIMPSRLCIYAMLYSLIQHNFTGGIFHVRLRT